MAVTASSYAAAINGSRSTQHHDAAAQPFLHPDFDPVDYLNSTLPPLATTSRPSQTVQSGRAVPLSELTSQLQTLLSQLNAHMSRLSNTLTQLTDDIIRSGGRLAYEVDVLRGETAGLTDTWNGRLSKDVALFVAKPSMKGNDEEVVVEENEGELQPDTNGVRNEPEYIERLRTLTLVRARLDDVTKVFDAAMAWPLAPSELSTTASSLISVSAPDSEAETRRREEDGKAYVDQLRTEIAELVGDGTDAGSMDAATHKIEQLRSLLEVWKGTAEEKARTRLVDGLAKPVEERRRVLEQSLGHGGRKTGGEQTRKAVDYRYGDLSASRGGTEGGYGFLQNLRNLKNEMYLE
jgi:hypothetical protein